MNGIGLTLIFICILCVIFKPVLMKGLEYGISGKKRVMWISLFVLIAVILPSIPLMTKGFEKYKDNRLKQMVHLNYIMTETLGISGDCEVQYNEVKWDDNKEVNRRKALINIYYYNYYNDENFTYDMLIEQYEDFCSGSLGLSYSDLEKYAEFIYDKEYIKYGELTSDNFSVDVFRDWCFRYIPKDEEWSEQQIIEVCETVMEHKEIVYKYNLATGIDDSVICFAFDYPFYLTEEDFEYYSYIPVASYNYDELENREKIIKCGEVEYYLKERVANMMTGEKGVYIYKVKIMGEDDEVCILSGGKFGSPMDEQAERLEQRFVVNDWNFELEIDTSNQKIYSRDSMRITLDGEDGVCTCITVEMVD